jgi:SAM-dependent MidA family methyltransferase
LLEYFQLINIDLTSQHYPENYRTEVNLKALNWLETVSHKIKKGYLVTIDYGHIASKYYHPQRYQGTLSCYYQHRYHCNPYINLGSQDITAHVDFSAMEIQGNLLGLELIGLTQQELFFINLGLGERLAELSSNKYKLSDVLARRDSLRQLIDPGGLGRFKVLIQGKGLSKVEKDIILSGLKHNLT